MRARDAGAGGKDGALVERVHLLHPARGPLRGAGKLAARPEGLDYIIVESSGISEPLPVAETFTFKDANGTSLSDVARLDTLVTVVDGASFLDELHAADTLRGRGWEAAEEDERTVAQLFCDQLEFANVIIMNKMDLMDDEGRARLRAILRRFNLAQSLSRRPGAASIRKDPRDRLFDLAKASSIPTGSGGNVWGSTPESVEYGISSFTFNSRRPSTWRASKSSRTPWRRTPRLLNALRDAALAGERVKVNLKTPVFRLRAGSSAPRAGMVGEQVESLAAGHGVAGGAQFTTPRRPGAAVDSAGPRRNEAGRRRRVEGPLG